jgi:hypothetical protein
MNMIYNSPTYCVVEFGAQGTHFGGFEIMDKMARREIYLEGSLAERFKLEVQQLISEQPSIEEIDDFLSKFNGMMQQPLSLH